MVTEEQLHELWAEIKKRIKEGGELNRPLWRALDAAVPVAMDHRIVVVGLDSHLQHEASFFHAAENQPLIHKVLGTVANKPLELLVIEGTTKADYEQHQQRVAAIEAMREKIVQGHIAHDDEGGTASEAADSAAAAGVSQLTLHLNRDFHQRYRDMSGRMQSTVRARFVRAALADIFEAEAQMIGMDGSDAVKDRQISRLIDKLGALLETDKVGLALEYERFKERQVAQL